MTYCKGGQNLAGWYTICFLDHYAPWNTLHPKSLCLSTHFTPWRNSLLSTLCSLVYFFPWNTLLPGTLCSKRCWVQTMLRREYYQGAKCYSKQSVPGSRVFQGSKVYWESKCSREFKSVLRSKLGWGKKRSREQQVLRSKMFWEAKSPKEQSVLRNKVCVSPLQVMKSNRYCQWYLEALIDRWCRNEPVLIHRGRGIKY